MVDTTSLKLPATLEKFVATQVKQGMYSSRKAVIVAAVAGEKRRAEQRTWLHSEIQKGLDSDLINDLDIEQVIRRGRARLAVRKRRSR